MFGLAEIARSLQTSSAREARRRAAILRTETDRAFDIVTRGSLAADQVAAILRRLQEESLWQSPTADELIDEWRENDEMPLRNFVELALGQIGYLPEEQQAHLLEHYYVLKRTMETDDLIIERDLANADATIERRRADLATERAAQAERAMHVAMGQAMARPAQDHHLVKPSPKFSENVETFLADKQHPRDNGKAYSVQTVKQTRGTFRLLNEFMAEKPVREYTRQEAGSFRRFLLKLPASHGKNTRSAVQISAHDAVARNETEGKPTLTMKTAKRHFSSLTQYWKWLKTEGHVDDVVFEGFEFPGTRSKKKKRDDWSPEDLERVFRKETWYGEQADRNSAYFWVPLIAAHSGMRLEEIARLRPGHHRERLKNCAGSASGKTISFARQWLEQAALTLASERMLRGRRPSMIRPLGSSKSALFNRGLSIYRAHSAADHRVDDQDRVLLAIAIRAAMGAEMPLTSDRIEAEANRLARMLFGGDDKLLKRSAEYAIRQMPHGHTSLGPPAGLTIAWGALEMAVAFSPEMPTSAPGNVVSVVIKGIMSFDDLDGEHAERPFRQQMAWIPQVWGRGRAALRFCSGEAADRERLPGPHMPSSLRTRRPNLRLSPEPGLSGLRRTACPHKPRGAIQWSAKRDMLLADRPLSAYLASIAEAGAWEEEIADLHRRRGPSEGGTVNVYTYLMALPHWRYWGGVLMDAGNVPDLDRAFLPSKQHIFQRWR